MVGQFTEAQQLHLATAITEELAILPERFRIQDEQLERRSELFTSSALSGSFHLKNWERMGLFSKILSKALRMCRRCNRKERRSIPWLLHSSTSESPIPRDFKNVSATTSLDLIPFPGPLQNLNISKFSNLNYIFRYSVIEAKAKEAGDKLESTEVKLGFANTTANLEQ